MKRHRVCLVLAGQRARHNHLIAHILVFQGNNHEEKDIGLF